MMSLAILSGLALPAAVEAAARHAAGALIAGAWEGALLAGVTAALLRVVPGATARLRFAVWTTVFLVLAALPVASAVLAAPAAGVAEALPPATAPIRADVRWSYALAALWMVAVLFRLGHLAVQAGRLRRLWRSAAPVPAEALAGLDMQLDKVEICTSEELDRPSVIGFFAPRILIPKWLFAQLTQGELHQIVLHEMEHLRRRDDWMNLLQKVALVLFPLNPALVWIDRRLATERELACDDGVLRRTHAPRAYAMCLTLLAERRMAWRTAKRGHGRLTELALGALGAIRRTDFSRRIESILRRGPGLRPATGRAFAAVFAAGVLGAGGALAHAPQVISFEPAVALAPEPAVARQQASTGTGSVASLETGKARMQDVVFHPDQVHAANVYAAEVRSASIHKAAHVSASRAAGTSAALSRHQVRTKAKPQPVRAVAVARADSTEDAPMEEEQRELQRSFMILTSWQESMPVPVLVRLPDGRTFLATYNPTPAHTGWIVFQL